MSCGCHKGCGSHCGCSCGCSCTHKSVCPRPKKPKGTCSDTVVIINCGDRDLDCKCHRKHRKCRKEKEIDVGRLTVCCNPVRFETCGQEKTLAACCVDGFRQPGALVPFPFPTLGMLPSMEFPSDFFSTTAQPPCCKKCGW